jgi:hypothetical protein
VESGPGCSVSSTAVVQAQAKTRARPVEASPVPVLPAAGSGCGRNGPAAAGRSPRGDVAAPAAGQLAVGVGEQGLRLAVWAASCRIQRIHGEPCLVMWPWRILRSELRTWGQPGPGAQLAGGWEAADVADLGNQGHGRQLGDAGQGHKGLDPGVGLASAPISLSRPAIGLARVSSTPQQSSMIARGLAAAPALQATPSPAWPTGSRVA